MLFWEGIGGHLDVLAKSTTTEVVVVAPFIKRVALQQVLKQVSPRVTVLCVTRWRVDELACGASDLDVYLDLNKREHARMLLLKELHAKYFRFNDKVIVGSCNVTSSALGYRNRANLELAVSLQAGEQTSAFEAMVTNQAIPVTPGMYSAMRRILEEMPTTPTLNDMTEEIKAVVDTCTNTIGWEQWLPTCRAPNLLYDAYTGHLDDLTLVTSNAAIKDLQQLAPPGGLTRTQFEAFVAGTILSSPMVAKLAEFAVTPRRFGEMKDLLRIIAPAASVTNDWQTIMRWLLHFAPDRFSINVANYSEIFTANW